MSQQCYSSSGISCDIANPVFCSSGRICPGLVGEEALLRLSPV
jgi:hypothetical protein